MNDATASLDPAAERRRLLAEILRKRAREVRTFPLSFAQQRLWFLDRMDPGSSAYTVPVPLHLRGALRPDLLERALTEVVRRHGSLRTTFTTLGTEPVQVVAPPPAALALPLADLASLPAAERGREAGRIAAEEAGRPFDLEAGPLFRARLLRLGAEEHVLVLVMHHVVTDGWSLGVLFRELSALYAASLAGAPPPLPPLPLQYTDFAAWQRGEGSVDAGGDREFWRAALRGAPPLLELPADRPRPPVPTHRGASLPLALDAADAARLREIGRAEGATLFMTLLAAFQLLLSRYAGEEDVVVGTPVAGRTRPELEGLIGLFVNTLAVRTDLAGDPTFRELLGRVRENLLGAYSHQDLPFDRLVEELAPGRSLSHTPVFQVMFAVQGGGSGGMGLDLPGVEAALVETGARTARFDLEVELRDEPGGVRGTLEYAVDLFGRGTAERMAAHFETLLRGIAASPDARVSEIPLLAPEERARVLEEWNATSRPYPAGLALHELFALQAARTPSATAVDAGSESLGYAELDRRSNQLAHWLVRRGVGGEKRVGLCLEPSPLVMVAVLGVLKAGAAYVPLDPSHPRDRLALILGDAAVPLLLTQAHLAAGLPEHAAEAVALDAAWGRIAREPHDAPGVPVAPERLAYVIYTSGSTGRPKGVCVEHRNVANTLLAALDVFGFGPGDRVPALASYAFDIWLFEAVAPLLGGAAVRLLPRERVVNMEALAEELESATVLHAVPVLMRQLAHHLGVHRRRPLPGVRLAFVGGDAVPPDLVEEMRGVFPAAEVRVLYGPTESAVVCASHPVPGRPEREMIGSPLPNARLYVRERGGAPAPTGVPGELLVGGAGVARGYLGRPEPTAERFVPDPYGGESGARLYRTGDRARWLPDGTLEFLGRLDHQVKVRGYRVEPGEVEAALERLPEVREAVVVARADAPGDRRLVAYLVAADGGRVPSPSELREHLKRSLPEQMVPSAFVALEALPLTPTGKVDRRALPAPERSGRGAGYVAPRTPLEELLARVWAGVLGMERVGVEENFFEIGGDSILSIQVVARARQAGVAITPRQVFERQTVAALALAAARGTDAAPAASWPARGEVELAPVQHRFFEEVAGERHHFNMAMLLRPRETLEARALERALAAVLDHHDALRMRFEERDGTWTQRYAGPDGRSPLARLDLSRLREADRRGAAGRAAAALQASLHLARGPLLRAALFERGGGEQRLLLLAHHLVTDGVSWRILLEDVQAACEQAARGATVALPAKTTSYQRWTAKLVEHARRGGFDAELPYWEGRGREPVAPLPVDLPDGRNTRSSVRHVAVSLDEADTRALLFEAPRAYGTQINDLLLAALVRAFARWTGEPRLRVELEGHGREEVFPGVDLSRTVGWLTAVHPLLLDLTGAADGEEALLRVREQLTRLPGRGIGYGALRYLAPPGVRAALAALPAPQVSFNYLGRFDRAVSDDAFFAGVAEPVGPTAGGDGERRHLFEVDGVVEGGRLRVTWSYGEALHRRETVESLAAGFLDELRALAAHCAAAGEPRAAPADPAPGAGEGTAAGLSADELEILALLMAEAGVEASAPETIRPRRPGERVPLTFAQKRLWFLEQLEPENRIYNDVDTLRLTGELDAAAMGRAFEEVVRRHEALRTVFVEEDGEPAQVVRDEFPAALDYLDLSHLPETGRMAEVRRVADETTRASFDLARGPLIRPLLLRLGERDHALLVPVHHIVTDGWSQGIVFRELFTLYDAFRQGRPSPLTPPGLQYGDFAVWQQRYLAAGALERQAAYWKERLRGVPALLELPTDRARPAEQSYRGRAYEFMVSREVSAQLQTLAQERGATLFMVLLAAFSALLARYTGEEDVVVGSPIANRTRPELESLVGLFANTLAFRTDTSGDPTFRELLERVRDEVFEDYAHQDLPFERLVEELRVERSLSYNPVYQVLLTLQNTPRGRLSLGGLEMYPLETTHDTSKLDLSLTAIPLGEGLYAGWEYSTELFDRASVARLTDRFVTLLRGISEHPDRRLSELPLVTPEERVRVLYGWNGSGRVEPDGAPVHERFGAQAERTPHAVALVCGGRTMTYAELRHRSDALARYLRARGVGPEVRVGVCVERSPETVVALLGILGAGGAYVPFDTAHPRDRLGYLVEDSGIALLLTQERLFAGLPGSATADVVFLDADWARIEAEPADVPGVAVLPGNAAYVIYTSGSTGKPKGVVVPHSALSGYTAVARDAYGIGPHDRVLQFASVAFDASAEEIWPALASGARLVLRTDEMLDSAAAFLDACREWGITVLDLPTAYWHELVAELSECAPGDRPPLPESLRLAIIGGERALPERLRAWRDCSGERIRLVNTYGPTEATVVATLCDVSSTAGEDEASPRHVPIGRPLPGVRAYVLDPRGEPTGIGIPGELYIGGSGVARGYLDRPGLTAERFLPEPFGAEPGARAYRTGDRVRWLPDGTLEFMGRVDHQVKIRGFRVELGEVEAALNRCPGVEEAVVVTREEARGETRLVAYVVPAAAGEVAAAELRSALREELPGYMLPAAFVPMEALPLTRNGKVDRRALPAPEARRSEGGPRGALPRNDVEGTIAAAWRDVLGVEEVGLDDNFFDLGGHSLLLVRLRSRLAGRFSREASVVVLFRYPTVRSLAGYLAQGGPETATPEWSAAEVESRRQAMRRRRDLRKLPEG